MLRVSIFEVHFEFRVWSSFRVSGLERLLFRVNGSVFRVSGVGSGDECSGLVIYGLWFMVYGLWFMVYGSVSGVYRLVIQGLGSEGFGSGGTLAVGTMTTSYGNSDHAM